MKDATFQLDTTGGAVILQHMTQDTVRKVTEACAERTRQIIKREYGPTVKYEVGAPNKRNGLRYHGEVRTTMPKSYRTAIAKKYRNAIISSARKACK